MNKFLAQDGVQNTNVALAKQPSRRRHSEPEILWQQNTTAPIQGFQVVASVYKITTD